MRLWDRAGLLLLLLQCSCLSSPSCRSCWPQLCPRLGGCSNSKSKALLEINYAAGSWLPEVLEDSWLYVSHPRKEKETHSLYGHLAMPAESLAQGLCSHKSNKVRSLHAQGCFGLRLGNNSFARRACVLTSQICCSPCTNVCFGKVVLVVSGT